MSETELPEATPPEALPEAADRLAQTPDRLAQTPDRLTQAADRLTQAVDRLVRQVAHWQPGRWSTSGTTGAGSAPEVAGTRADRVYALVQRLADWGADAEGRPHRPVPRLGDLVLPDQLRVIADDLLTEGAPQDALTAAADEVDAVRRTL